jgi:hypothetical protein
LNSGFCAFPDVLNVFDRPTGLFQLFAMPVRLRILRSPFVVFLKLLSASRAVRSRTVGLIVKDVEGSDAAYFEVISEKLLEGPENNHEKREDSLSCCRCS